MTGSHHSNRSSFASATKHRGAWLLSVLSALSACGRGADDGPAPNVPPQAAAPAATSLPALSRGSGDAAPTDPAPRIACAKGALNVSVRQGSLRSMLAEVERQAGITIVVAPSTGLEPLGGESSGATRDNLDESAITEETAAHGLLSPDPAVRRHALSRGVDMQYALPESTLRQLAHVDADPGTRLLALAALGREPAANSPNARAAAQAALGDGDAAVRQQAKDLLEQLDLAAIPSDLWPEPSAPPPTP